MKKTKRYDEGGGVDVEDMKTNANEGKGIFSGAAAADESDTYAPKTRSFSTVRPERPRPKVAKPTPKASQSFPIKEPKMESGADVMKRGRAGESDSGKNAALEKLKSDREATASRDARKKSAMVDKANAGVPDIRKNVDVATDRLNAGKPKSSSNAGLAAAGAALAAGAGTLLGRSKMKSGTKDEESTRTSSPGRSPVRNISTEESLFENEGGRSYKKGGKVSSASSRGDGCAQRGKTKGRMM